VRGQMQIVISIEDEFYDYIKEQVKDGITNPLKVVIVNGKILPKGHGRLIDADYLREDFKASKRISFAERMDISCIVDHAPAIIEADRSDVI
jgi:hypothetical protein